MNLTENRKYKVRFKAGEDTFEKYVRGENIIEGLQKFYYNLPCYPVISIEEVIE